jgi:probable F420-dependent oxidoreductase
MRVGVTVPMSVSDGPRRISSWPEILAFARHAEAIGLDSVWVCDHFFSSPPGGEVEGIHEGWTILSALAASTRRVEVGSLVMSTSFRNPALLAKMAASTDAVSDGRVVLGLGAGWYDAEYVAFGYATDHRVGRFEEALQIITALLSGDSVTFSGRYYCVREAALLPPPQRPIPILVAGKGPRMLRLVARHADAWNTAWFGKPDDRLRRRLSDLEEALAAEGRDPKTLRRTVGMDVQDPDAEGSEQRGRRAVSGLGLPARRSPRRVRRARLRRRDRRLEPRTERSLDHLAEATAKTSGT